MPRFSFKTAQGFFRNQNINHGFFRTKVINNRHLRSFFQRVDTPSMSFLKSGVMNKRPRFYFTTLALVVISYAALNTPFNASKIMKAHATLRGESVHRDKPLTDEDLIMGLRMLGEQINTLANSCLFRPSNVVDKLDMYLHHKNETVGALAMHLLGKLAKEDIYAHRIIVLDDIGESLSKYLSSDLGKTAAFELMDKLFDDDRKLSLIASDQVVEHLVAPLCNHLSLTRDMETKEVISKHLLSICQNLRVQKWNLQASPDHNITHQIETYLQKHQQEKGTTVYDNLQECLAFLANKRAIVRHSYTAVWRNTSEKMLDLGTTLAGTTAAYVYTYTRWVNAAKAPKAFAKYNAVLSALAVGAIGTMELFRSVSLRSDAAKRLASELKLYSFIDDDLPDIYRKFMSADPRLRETVPSKSQSLASPTAFNELVPVMQFACFAIAWLRVKYIVPTAIAMKMAFMVRDSYHDMRETSMFDYKKNTGKGLQ